MNGFHIRKKVMADHKTWPLLCKSNEVSESVKTSVNGKIELKTRKRLIFMWSLRKLVTGAIVECELCPLLVLSAVTVLQWGDGMAAGNMETC